jgi:Co/Zn/Cd efflux system component
MEAVDRVLRPEPVDGKVMFATATLGLLVNLAMMKILHQGHGHGGGHHAQRHQRHHAGHGRLGRQQ